MTKDLAQMIAVAVALNAMGYWAFSDNANFVYTIGEAVLAWAAIVGAVALLMEFNKSRKT